jgi:epoxyqueuosine reductase
VGDHAELRFLPEWLARGYAGEMQYLQESASLRADVRAVLPGARSVVVVGTLYNVVPDANPVTADGLARIARYAGGDDYHDILRVRINMLVAWMEQASPEPFEARAFVDSGPVQERVYAQYAGLGWIGKNTCLINPELGSFLFLSEIICTLPLEPDTQGLDGCGTCTRCIEACPSGALVEPYVLDATRCLSYLTIELRGGIEPSLRPAMGAHVFGCDICQTVCPYNQPPHLASDPTWRPRPELVSPRLASLWLRSDEELRAVVKGTALTRPKLEGLRRNLAVAIGNAGDAEAVAALCTPADERPSADTPMVQEHIEWALDEQRRRRD